MQESTNLNPPVSTMPDIPGLRFRHFRDERDYAPMAAVTSAHWQGEGATWAETADDVAVSLEHLVNSDLVKDAIVAEVDGQPLAYGRMRWRDEVGGSLVYSASCHIDPAYWETELPAAVLGWLETRASELAAGHDPERPKTLEVYCMDTPTPIRALIERSGYAIERYFAEMIRLSLDDIPNFPLPDGLEVRSVTPDQYRAIWEADVEAFRDHWSFVEPKETHYERFLNDERMFQPELWQIAWDVEKNEVAGQVRTFIDHNENKTFGRKRGYTEEISTRRPYRRRGLARALIVRSLQAQREAGMTESALGVDMDSPTGATRVYEDCGFRVTMMELLWRKPL